MTNVIGNSIATAVVAQLEPRRNAVRDAPPLSTALPQTVGR